MPLLLFACESISIRRTFLPFRANPAAKEMLEDVLPTPPFCEAIEITIRKLNLPNPHRVILLAFLVPYRIHLHLLICQLGNQWRAMKPASCCGRDWLSASSSPVTAQPTL